MRPASPRIPRKSSREIGMARTAGVASGRLATIRLPDNVVPGPDSAAISIRRVVRFSRNVGQPDHILANPSMGHKPERRPIPATSRRSFPRRTSSPYARKSLRTEACSCGPSSWRNCSTCTWRRRRPGGRSSPGCSRPTKPPLPGRCAVHNAASALGSPPRGWPAAGRRSSALRRG